MVADFGWRLFDTQYPSRRLKEHLKGPKRPVCFVWVASRRGSGKAHWTNWLDIGPTSRPGVSFHVSDASDILPQCCLFHIRPLKMMMSSSFWMPSMCFPTDSTAMCGKPGFGFRVCIVEDIFSQWEGEDFGGVTWNFSQDCCRNEMDPSWIQGRL